MSEWTVVTVIVVLVGLGVSVMAPVLKLNSTITRLSTLIDGALRDMKELKETDAAIRQHATEAHQRIHERINENEDKLQNHENRIVVLEERHKKGEKA